MLLVRRRTIVSSLFSLALSVALNAQQPEIPGPSFEDIMNLRDIGSAVISPDGQTIVYTVRSTDWDENGYDTEIWLVRSGEEPFQDHYDELTSAWQKHLRSGSY